jgi:peptidyl-prolyl cis-trans isomerase SurA
LFLLDLYLRSFCRALSWQRTCFRVGGLTFLALLVVASTSRTVLAQNTQTTLRIAALVNDDVITLFDLQARLNLIVLSSQLPATDEVRQRLAPQVLRTLIDDRLRLQETRKQKIAVTDQEIDNAVREIEERNKMPRGGMYALLDQNRIDRGTLRLQIEAEISWRKMIMNQVRANVVISDEAVDDAIQRIEANKGQPEYLLNEIFIAMGTGKSADETRQITERLRQQITEGANFEELARSFSQSASAASGGNLGWVREDQFDPALIKAIQTLNAGELSQPIQGIDGFYILSLRGRRLSEGLPPPDMTLTLQQVFVPAQAGDIAQRTAVAENISAQAKSCEDMDAAGKKLASPQSGRLSNIKLSRLPPQGRGEVAQLSDRQASKPIRLGDGVMVLMICERTGDRNNEDVRNRIRNMLAGERAELLSRRQMRDLYRSAFVDIRR